MRVVLVVVILGLVDLLEGVELLCVSGAGCILHLLRLMVLVILRQLEGLVVLLSGHPFFIIFPHAVAALLLRLAWQLLLPLLFRLVLNRLVLVAEALLLLFPLFGNDIRLCVHVLIVGGYAYLHLFLDVPVDLLVVLNLILDLRSHVLQVAGQLFLAHRLLGLFTAAQFAPCLLVAGQKIVLDPRLVVELQLVLQVGLNRLGGLELSLGGAALSLLLVAVLRPLRSLVELRRNELVTHVAVLARGQLLRVVIIMRLLVASVDVFLVIVVVRAVGVFGPGLLRRIETAEVILLRPRIILAEFLLSGL